VAVLVPFAVTVSPVPPVAGPAERPDDTALDARRRNRGAEGDERPGERVAGRVGQVGPGGGDRRGTEMAIAAVDAAVAATFASGVMCA
jgi:hypothetical protein